MRYVLIFVVFVLIMASAGSSIADEDAYIYPQSSVYKFRNGERSEDIRVFRSNGVLRFEYYCDGARRAGGVLADLNGRPIRGDLVGVDLLSASNGCTSSVAFGAYFVESRIGTRTSRIVFGFDGPRLVTFVPD